MSSGSCPAFATTSWEAKPGAPTRSSYAPSGSLSSRKRPSSSTVRIFGSAGPACPALRGHARAEGVIVTPRSSHHPPGGCAPRCARVRRALRLAPQEPPSRCSPGPWCRPLPHPQLLYRVDVRLACLPARAPDRPSARRRRPPACRDSVTSSFGSSRVSSNPVEAHTASPTTATAAAAATTLGSHDYSSCRDGRGGCAGCCQAGPCGPATRTAPSRSAMPCGPHPIRDRASCAAAPRLA